MKTPDSAPEEKPKEELTSEEEAQYLHYMLTHPETAVPPEKREDCEKYVAKIREDLNTLKETDLVSRLNLITTKAEALDSELREKGKKYLEQLTQVLDFLRKETNITKEAYEELEAEYRVISRAVGIINGDTLNHELDLRPKKYS